MNARWCLHCTPPHSVAAAIQRSKRAHNPEELQFRNGPEGLQRLFALCIPGSEDGSGIRADSGAPGAPARVPLRFLRAAELQGPPLRALPTSAPPWPPRGPSPVGAAGSVLKPRAQSVLGLTLHLCGALPVSTINVKLDVVAFF